MHHHISRHSCGDTELDVFIETRGPDSGEQAFLARILSFEII